ncbi:hypothetical protein P3T76_004873 [Phytophthora citrophthora]|uniref:Uncharacterized protein n=1 Tax=Phytophthora citrophthora TaxID=4793 RepID=A0AAD9LQ98_9STRA|nr:hypothetical protein P3T76_004873 [Phytophthora citrophthora]
MCSWHHQHYSTTIARRRPNRFDTNTVQCPFESRSLSAKDSPADIRSFDQHRLISIGNRSATKGAARSRRRMSTERLVPGDGHNLVVLARLEATGLKTVSGYSSSYDDVFPTALDGISRSCNPSLHKNRLMKFMCLSRREFKFCVDVLNQTVEDFFPCLPCYGCGYLWCFTTCGLSLCFSEPCTKQLSNNLELVLRRLNNREELLYRGVVWSLKRGQRTHTSWIEIAQLVYE